MALVAALGPAPLLAEAPKIPPAPSQQPPEVPRRNPAVTYLMQEYGLSESEALEKNNLQTDIVQLLQTIHESGDVAFAGVTVQYRPTYRVIVSFADNKDRNALLQSIPPHLRRYVQLRVAKRSKEGTKQGQGRIRQALGSQVDYVVGYRNASDKFVIDVASEADAERLRSSLPDDLKADVEFNIAPLPKPEALPTGVRPGDWAEAGYGVYTGSTYSGAPCTLAFAVTYGASNTKGILTAGHCTLPKGIPYADHWATFPSAITKQTANQYDYAIYETTGLNSDYQVYYDNANNRIPEFPTSGWLHVTNYISGWNQFNGQTMCKSGIVTGLTCGTIIDDSYPWRAGYWFIKVSHTKQYDISNPGDSGAPWFMYPGSSIDITAAGIHGGGEGTGYDSVAIYMPIDRAFEHVSNVKLVFKP
jgi:V8-like Glu-specific endopeptidase